MTLTRACITVAVTSVVGMVAGTGIGAALGYWCPNYYRAVLVQQPGVEFDPVQIGVGFGLNTGLFTGVAVGVLVVAIVAYFELRVRQEQIRHGQPAGWDANES